ncbi:MAG TPA: arylsulfatase [Candidatus Hydrogenedentes bacterium]|nr:arylsulfatase [Candidatus Hydrogenedentota bacterium]
MTYTGRRISRRDAFKLAAAGAAALSAAPRARSAQPLSGKPNILFIMADQYRGDCVGADGNTAIITPHLDRIAREGVLFSKAYTSVPSCTPARAGLLSGLSPWNHGMLAYGKVGWKYPRELPQEMRNAGYYTLGIGKMHWSPQRSLHGFHQTILDESSRVESIDFRSDYQSWFYSQAPTLDWHATGLGFNDYDARPYVLPERLHTVAWTGDTAVNFLANYDREEPFFLKISFARPHSPYDPPERFWKLYEDRDIPKAVVGEWAAKYAPRSGDESNLWHGDLGPEQVRTSRIGYYGNVTFIDEQIGRMLTALEDRGWLENTLILFTADHGDMTGDHHLWRKTYAYEASARIPMIIRWPERLVNAKRGQRLRQPVELRDVMATFLDAAGAGVPDDIDGDSLLKLARGETDGWRPWLDLEHGRCYGPENHWNALTDGRWKYIYHAHLGEEQLFDLDTDPDELTDLSKADPAETARWRDRMIEHLSVRGEHFVKDGKLVVREESLLYGPNYPGTWEDAQKAGKTG